MAFLRAAFSSLSVSPFEPAVLACASSCTLQPGHRLTKPGLPGLSSNSSPQTLHTLMGNAMRKMILDSRAILPLCYE